MLAYQKHSRQLLITMAPSEVLGDGDAFIAVASEAETKLSLFVRQDNERHAGKAQVNLWPLKAHPIYSPQGPPQHW